MKVGNHVVKWHHTKTHNELHETETDKTICKIVNLDTGETVSEGSAVRYYKDTPCRQKGCKAALAAALLTFNKNDRLPYWDAYRVSKPGTRWQQDHQEVVAH